MNRRDFIRNTAGLLVPAYLSGMEESDAQFALPSWQATGPLISSCDPHFADVQALCTFNNTAANVGQDGNAPTITGATFVSSPAGPFATDCLNLLANGSATSNQAIFVQNSAYLMGTAPGTLEFWYQAPASTGSGQIFGWGVGTISDFQGIEIAATDTSATLFASNTSGTYNIFGGVVGAINSAAWNAIAISFDGSTMYFFTQGVLRASASYSGSLTTTKLNSGFNVQSGLPSPSKAVQLAEFRWTQGFCRYTTNYTPTGPFATC